LSLSIHERVRSLKKLTFATPKELIALLCVAARRRRRRARPRRSSRAERKARIADCKA
jgi:hypothetical protein